MIEKKVEVQKKLSDEDKALLPHWLSEEGLFVLSSEGEASLFGS